MPRAALVLASLVALAAAGCGVADFEPLAQSPSAAEDTALLAQAARRAGLERDPAVARHVARALEEARERALADAWLDRIGRDASRVTPAEVKSFYAANPALFAERRIYHYEELAVAPPERLLAPLAAEAAVARELREIGTWLGQEGVPVPAPRAVIRAAEDVPLGTLRRLAQMREGEIALLGAPGAVLVVQLVQARPSPVSEPEAEGAIERFLANRRRGELARGELERLRRGARAQQVSLTSRRQS